MQARSLCWAGVRVIPTAPGSGLAGAVFHLLGNWHFFRGPHSAAFHPHQLPFRGRALSCQQDEKASFSSSLQSTLEISVPSLQPFYCLPTAASSSKKCSTPTSAMKPSPSPPTNWPRLQDAR